MELKAPGKHLHFASFEDENVQDEERAKSNSLRAVLEERQMDSSVLICKIFLVDLCFSVSVLK